MKIHQDDVCKSFSNVNDVCVVDGLSGEKCECIDHMQNRMGVARDVN